MQGLPPLSSQGVFSVSASATIDAPRDAVWRVLMDWGSYHEWNPFIRNQRLCDPHRNPLGASQQSPRVGAHLLMQPVHIPPFPATSALEVITHFDPDNYRCAWENVDYPGWLLRSVRWQALVEVEVDGRRQTRYETVGVFGGPLAYVLWLVLARGLRAAFSAMAEGLRARCISHAG